MTNIPGLEKWNLLLLLQTFQFWICTSTALSPLCRYFLRTSLLVREVPDWRGGINEVGLQFFNLLGFTALSIEVSAGEVSASPSGRRFFDITDFYHYIMMHPFNNFYTPLSGAPTKCFKSGPALANAGRECVSISPLITTTAEVSTTVRFNTFVLATVSNRGESEPEWS